MRAAALDAVTLDAHGTLVRLADPVPALVNVLAERGVERTPETVLAGFKSEVAHYAPRASEGYDEESLTRLQRECAGVFLDAVEAKLDPAEFAPAYVGALHFEVLPGVLESLDRLRALGLELAVVANWDLSLRRLLEEVDLARYFVVVVHAARKPAPKGLLRALAELQIDPARALHVGDDGADREAAAAAGMWFAPTPISEAVPTIR
ncbi:MAG: HAD-IA family hydrolase [Actinomycetota bacterium]|nr:HAD-IA family hydrolase [Actinomycetota bacterium]